MAILTSKDLLTRIKDRIGEDTSDEALTFIEDITDTINDYESRTQDNTSWKTKYEENDKSWREKYKARFFSTDPSEDDPDPSDDDPKPLSYDNLFKEGE